MEIVYGPVSSWRLKRSLGIDLICREKACPFDCIYCSLGETVEKTEKRQEFVPSKEVEEALKLALEEVEADIITLAGTGEPTLAENMGEVIDIAKETTNLPVAVLTNSSLMDRPDVRRELAKADKVIGSLDSPNQEIFEKVNRPIEGLSLDKIISGMKKFRKEFEGEFAIEGMFVPENKEFSDEIATIINRIAPDEVQINTPLTTSNATPLDKKELEKIHERFNGMKTRTVYEEKKIKVESKIGKEKLRKLKRGRE